MIVSNIHPVHKPIKGIPWDTVQRGSSKYLRGDPTTPGYPSYPGVYERSIKDLLKITKEEVHGPHIWAPLPQQPISIKDTQHLMSKLTGTAIPDAWKEQSGLALGGIGGQLPGGMSFELQISPTYKRDTSPGPGFTNDFYLSYRLINTMK